MNEKTEKYFGLKFPDEVTTFKFLNISVRNLCLNKFHYFYNQLVLHYKDYNYESVGLL